MFEYDPSLISRSSPSPPRRAIVAEKYEKEKQRKIDSSIASATSFSIAKNDSNVNNISSTSDAASIQNTIDPDAYIISLLQNAEEKKNATTTNAKANSSASSQVLLYLDYSPAVVKTLSNMHKKAQSKAQSSHAGRNSDRVKKNIGHLLVGVFGEKRLNQFFDNVDEFEVEGEEKKHADREDDDDDDTSDDNEIEHKTERASVADESNSATTKNNREQQLSKQKEKEVVGASLGFLLGLGNEIVSGTNEEDDENPRRNNNKTDEIAAAEDEEMFLREIENAKRVLQHKTSGIDVNKATTTPSKKLIEKKQQPQEQKEPEVDEDAEQHSSPSTPPRHEETNQDLTENKSPLITKSQVPTQKLKTILQTRKRCELTNLPDPSVLLEMIVQEHTEMRRQSEKEENARYRHMVQGIELGKYYDDDGNEIYGNGNISTKKQHNAKKDLSSGFIEHFHAKLNWAIQELFQSQKTQDQVQAQYNHFVLEAARRIDTLEKSIDSLRDEKIAHEETKQELERERERAMVLFEGTSNSNNQNEKEKIANASNFQSIEDNDPNSSLIINTRNNNAILRRGRFRSLPPPSSSTSNVIHSHHQRRPLLSTVSQFLSCDKLILQQQQKLAEQEEKFLQQQQQQQHQKQQNNEKSQTPPPTFSKSIDQDDDDVSWQKDQAPSKTPQPKNINNVANSKTSNTTNNNNNAAIHREVSLTTRNDYTELNNQMLSLTYEIASLKDENKKLKYQLEVGLVQQENNFQTAFEGLNSERDSLKKALDATKEELYIAQRLKGNSTDEIQALSHMLLSLRKELAKTFDVLFVDKEKHLSDFLLATSPFDAPVTIFREFFAVAVDVHDEGNNNGSGFIINPSDGDADSSNNNNNNNVLLNKQFTKNWKDNLRTILSKEPSDDQIGRLSPLEPTSTTHLMNIGLVTLNQIRSLYSQLLNSINDTTQRQRIVAKNFMTNQKEVRKNIAQRRKDDDHKNAKLVSALESAQEKLVEMVRESKNLKSSIGELKEEKKNGDERIQQLLGQIQRLRKHRDVEHEENDENNEQETLRPKSGGTATSSRRTKVSQNQQSDEENESNEKSGTDHDEDDKTNENLENAQMVLHTNKTSAAPLALDENSKNKNKISAGPSSLLGLLNQNKDKNRVDSANAKPKPKENKDKKSNTSTPTKKQQTTTTTSTTTASTSKTASRASSASNKNGKKIKSRTTSFVHQQNNDDDDKDHDVTQHENEENNDEIQNVTDYRSDSQIDMETQTPERLLFSLVKELAEELILSEQEKRDSAIEKSIKNEQNENSIDADGGDQVENIKNISNEPNNSSHDDEASEEKLEKKIATEEKSTQYESASNDELQPEEMTPDFAKVLSTLDEIGLDQKLLRNFKTLRLNDDMLQYIDNEDLITVGLELVAHRRAFFFSIGKSPDLAHSARKLASAEETETNVESNGVNPDDNNNNDPNWWSSSMKSKVVACQTVAPETKSKYAQTTVDLTLPPSILDKTADDSVLERYRQRKEQEEKSAAAEKLKNDQHRNNIDSPSLSAATTTTPTLLSQKSTSVAPVLVVEDKPTTSTLAKPHPLVSSTTTTSSHQVALSSETPTTNIIPQQVEKKKDQLDLDALLADATDYLKKSEKQKEIKSIAASNENNISDEKPSSASFRKSTSPIQQQQQQQAGSPSKTGNGGKKNNNSNSSPTGKNNKDPGSPGRGGGGEKKGGKKSTAFDDNFDDQQQQLIGVSQAEHDGLQRKYDNLNSAYIDASLRVRQLEAEGGQSNTKLKMTSDQLRSTTERLIETQKSRDTEQIAAREAQVDLESAKEKLANLEKKLLHAEEKRMQEALRAVDDMKRVQEQLEAALHSDVVDKLKAKEKLFLGGSQAMMQALKALMNSVVCPHCLEPLREACVHVPCGHVICRSCITKFHEEDVGCTIRLDPVTNLFAPSGISFNVKSTKNVNSTSSFFNVNKKFESNRNNNKEKHVVAVLPSREYLLPPPVGSGERFTPIRGNPAEIAKNVAQSDEFPSEAGDNTVNDGKTPSSPQQQTQQQPVSFVSSPSSPPRLQNNNNSNNASPLISPANATQQMLNSLHLCCAECERTGGVDGSGLSGIFAHGTGLRSGSSAISLTGFVTDIPPTQIVRFPLMDTLVASAEFAMKSAQQSRRAVIKNSMVVDAREDGQEDVDVLVNETKMKRIEIETEKSVLNLETSAASVSVKPIIGSRIHAAALRGRLLPEPQGVDLDEEENVVGVNTNSKQGYNNINNENGGDNGRGKNGNITKNTSGGQKANVHETANRDKNGMNAKMSGNAFAKAADDWV